MKFLYSTDVKKKLSDTNPFYGHELLTSQLLSIKTSHDFNLL